MENNNYYEIDLDIWKQFPIKIVPIKQLDTGRKIRINLYSNDYVYDISKSQVTVYIKKDKKNIIFNNCKIIDKNIIEIEITSSMVETAGQYNAEIDIMSEGISTFNFIIEVAETNKDTVQITQTSEYKALVELFKYINNISSRFIDINSQLEKKANKSDIGTPLIANSIIDMVDTSKIYVYTGTEEGYTAGNWYSYDGSKWVSGGVYNSQGIGDGEITEVKLTEKYVVAVLGKNLFNKETVQQGYFVDYTDGKIRKLESCSASDYIRVIAGVSYYLSGTRQQYALYNLKREFISGKAGFTSLETPIIVPEVDGYIRLTVANTEIDSVQLEEGTEGTEYEPYSKKISNDNISDENINFISKKIGVDTKIENDISNIINSCKFIKGTIGKNLFDKDTVTINSYVDYTDGKVRTLSTCVASDYIDIHLFNSITISGTKQQYATYDENKTFLRGGIRVDEFIKQESDYYIRLTVANTEIDNVQLEEGTEATEYEPYGIKLSNDNISDENINYLIDKLKIFKENIITVKQDGTGDYTTIFEAVTSITNSNKDNQYWIHVYEGTYHINEEVLQFSDFTKHPKGLFLLDYVHLVGIGDKRKIILDCTFADDIGLTISTNFSTLNLNKSNIVKNITVKAKNCRYAIHDETNGVVENYTRELDNCDVIHEGNAEGLWQWDCAYGIGFGGGSKFVYRNCTFETKSETIGNAAFGGHNWDNQSNYSEFEFEGCNFLHSGLLGTENEVAFRMGATGNQYQDRFNFKGCNFNTGKIRLKKESTVDTIEFVVGGYANKHIDLDYPDIEPTTLPEFIATENLK